jgi:alkylhydroperoxidase family enzyme
VRERGILITAAASTMGDSYCSLAWGQKLAAVSSAELAAGVLTGSDQGLSDSERALARWAREVAADPSHATSEGVDALRAAGYDDAQILAVTVFVSLRLAFSTVNDALGVHPEREMNQNVPPEVRQVVTWGRPIVAP